VENVACAEQSSRTDERIAIRNVDAVADERRGRQSLIDVADRPH
jgi:hypothetical protein